MKQSLRYLSPQFNSQRMISEYMTQLYEPAHSAFQDVSRDSFASARKHQEWERVVQAKWDRIEFVGADGAPDGPITTGQSLPLRASVDLAGLAADDVRVEAVVGRVGVSGQLEETEVIILKPVESHGTVRILQYVEQHQSGYLKAGVTPAIMRWKAREGKRPNRPRRSIRRRHRSKMR